MERQNAVKALEPYKARIVFYDQLLGHAYKAYTDYFEQRKVVDRLAGVIKAIEDYAPGES